MSLLPSRKPDVSTEQDGELRVVGMEEENADEVFEVLSSGTARTILSRVYEDPVTASEIADSTDNSIQTVTYHLENLRDAGLIQISGSQYSEKGREMQVYTPADDPVVVFVGTEDRKKNFLDLFKELVGAIHILAIASVFLYLIENYGGRTGGSNASSVFGGLTLGFVLGGSFILALSVFWWYWKHS